MAAQIFLKLGEVGAESGKFSQKLLKGGKGPKLAVKFSLASDLGSWENFSPMVKGNTNEQTGKRLGLWSNWEIILSNGPLFQYSER